MFEIVEKHKRTGEEKKVILLEILAALAIVMVVGALVWLVFFKTAG
jgi:amino acid permease